jgi:hypothetical protein
MPSHPLSRFRDLQKMVRRRQCERNSHPAFSMSESERGCREGMPRLKALSPRELAVRFTDTESYFVSEASVYRLLKAHDLIASPAFIVMKAAD